MTIEPKTTPPQLCPQCGARVSKLEKHLKKAHDPIKLAERRKTELAQRATKISAKNFERIEKAREQFLITTVQCTICSAQINLKLLVDHCYREHHSPLPPEMRALYGLTESKNMFKSSKEREDYWRKATGIGEKGDDIFDRGMTVQGGAYGLGKSRKH